MATLVIWLGMGGHVLAQARYDNEQTPEGWAWALIKQGKEVNFDVPCKKPAPDPRVLDEADWTDSCRQLSAAFLVDVLTHETLRKQVPFAGVHIIGARIVGDIRLRNAKLDRAFIVDRSRIENGIDLVAARTDSIIGFVGSRVAGTVTAELFHAELTLRLFNTEFRQAVGLNNARIDGNVSLDGAAFDKNLSASGLQVGASLFMRSSEQYGARFKEVNLRRAKVTGNVEMNGAAFDGDLHADALQVGASLFMNSTQRNKASFKEVSLRGAKVTGNVEMNGAAFDGHLHADALQVGDSLSMFNVTGAQPTKMQFARIGGNLDMRRATLAEFDLSGASVAGELRLGRDEHSNTQAFWRPKVSKPGDLILRNTRVANLTDTENAWPSSGHLHLDGFAFARLGGFADDTEAKMRGRGMNWWDGWARRDPAYSPVPYEQLYAAVILAGDRKAADEIRFLGRVRQHETETSWWLWIFLGFLRYVAGFGIGDYTFRVLYWVIAISFAGALYLWTSVQTARAHGPVWCFGASLSRLLPVIEINKEFSTFFHDPNRTNLTGWQSFVFSFIAIVGWVLGAILVAAVSGLMLKA